MPTTHHVSDLHRPELQPYRTLRRPLEHIKEGIFVAEGEKAVRRLLNSEIETVSLLLTEEWFRSLQDTKGIHQEALHVFIAPKTAVEEIVGHNLHQGIMAVGRVPQNVRLDELFSKPFRTRLFVALDGLMNSENVGIVIRNCAAFGVDAVIVGETSSSPYLRRAVRNSMGTIFGMRISHVENLAEVLRKLKHEYQVTNLATDLNARQSLEECPITGSTCIVLGSEGDGIREEIINLCDARVVIPMMNGTDSLNVASASAVVLYEVRKKLGLLTT